MKNYIVRNCPAILKTTLICNDFSGSLYTPRPCKDITDCIMKRIYERCELYEFNYPVNQAIQMLTQNIRDMLEIEDAE